MRYITVAHIKESYIDYLKKTHEGDFQFREHMKDETNLAICFEIGNDIWAIPIILGDDGIGAEIIIEGSIWASVRFDRMFPVSPDTILEISDQHLYKDKANKAFIEKVNEYLSKVFYNEFEDQIAANMFCTKIQLVKDKVEAYKWYKKANSLLQACDLWKRMAWETGELNEDILNKFVKESFIYS